MFVSSKWSSETLHFFLSFHNQLHNLHLQQNPFFVHKILKGYCRIWIQNRLLTPLSNLHVQDNCCPWTTLLSNHAVKAVSRGTKQKSEEKSKGRKRRLPTDRGSQKALFRPAVVMPGPGSSCGAGLEPPKGDRQEQKGAHTKLKREISGYMEMIKMID